MLVVMICTVMTRTQRLLFFLTRITSVKVSIFISFDFYLIVFYFQKGVIFIHALLYVQISPYFNQYEVSNFYLLLQRYFFLELLIWNNFGLPFFHLPFFPFAEESRVQEDPLICELERNNNPFCFIVWTVGCILFNRKTYKIRFLLFYLFYR